VSCFQLQSVNDVTKNKKNGGQRCFLQGITLYDFILERDEHIGPRIKETIPIYSDTSLGSMNCVMSDA
jgi:hypothetical protein